MVFFSQFAPFLDGQGLGLLGWLQRKRKYKRCGLVCKFFSSGFLSEMLPWFLLSSPCLLESLFCMVSCVSFLVKSSFHKGIRIIWRLFCRWNRAQCMLGFWVKCCHAFFSVPRLSWEAVLYGQGLGLLGCPNALTESNSWHSDHVETEESFYPHPSPISVSASPRGVGT